MTKRDTTILGPVCIQGFPFA
ncbi:hypothetical protein BOV_A0925 [Brucella ovis ATCC 25840]|uniref:Uncharacterized protein n=1 Tax=Brucella ovis (strain ATCC 25840 / 63/290 / NCTC 10512) TaxID=444178 RepID=A0A0H3ATM1_BRUO2|nr:hypothetical protein BOV_A0925 [Brucella ovis ATCC 25840]